MADLSLQKKNCVVEGGIHTVCLQPSGSEAFRACSVARYAIFTFKGFEMLQANRVPQRIWHIVTLPESMAYWDYKPVTVSWHQLNHWPECRNLWALRYGGLTLAKHLTIFDETARMARVLWVSCVFTLTPLSQLTEEPLQSALNIEIDETAGIIFLLGCIFLANSVSSTVSKMSNHFEA